MKTKPKTRPDQINAIDKAIKQSDTDILPSKIDAIDKVMKQLQKKIDQGIDVELNRERISILSHYKHEAETISARLKCFSQNLEILSNQFPDLTESSPDIDPNEPPYIKSNDSVPFSRIFPKTSLAEIRQIISFVIALANIISLVFQSVSKLPSFDDIHSVPETSVEEQDSSVPKSY
jgi:hypothetical protein